MNTIAGRRRKVSEDSAAAPSDLFYSVLQMYFLLKLLHVDYNILKTTNFLLHIKTQIGTIYVT